MQSQPHSETKQKYLVFSVPSAYGSLGGWGDRMRGLWRAAEIANATRRTLVIDWPEFAKVFDVPALPACARTALSLTCRESTDALTSPTGTYAGAECLTLPFRGVGRNCVGLLDQPMSSRNVTFDHNYSAEMAV